MYDNSNTITEVNNIRGIPGVITVTVFLRSQDVLTHTMAILRKLSLGPVDRIVFRVTIYILLTNV